jgi:hypothetical protein
LDGFAGAFVKATSSLYCHEQKVQLYFNSVVKTEVELSYGCLMKWIVCIYPTQASVFWLESDFKYSYTSIASSPPTCACAIKEMP